MDRFCPFMNVIVGSFADTQESGNHHLAKAGSLQFVSHSKAATVRAHAATALGATESVTLTNHVFGPSDNFWSRITHDAQFHVFMSAKGGTFDQIHARK